MPKKASRKGLREKTHPAHPTHPDRRLAREAVTDRICTVSGFDLDTLGVTVSVETVTRRLPSRALRALPNDLRGIANAYGALLERIEAGGVCREFGGGGGGGCTTVGGGPQSAMIADVTMLREARALIGLGRCKVARIGGDFAHLDIVEGVVMGASLSEILRQAGIAPSPARLRKMGCVLVGGLSRMADGMPGAFWSN